MTEEEFKNLKVGDVVQYHDSFMVEITDTSYPDGIIVNVGKLKGTKIGETTLLNDYTGYTKLPLYSSPLYKAMSEANASNEKQEEE